jgi:hypothetical protein
VIDDQAPAGGYMAIQSSDGALGIGSMLDHPQTEDQIELLGLKWQPFNIGLGYTVRKPNGKCSGVGVRCVTQIDGRYLRAAGQKHFGEAARSATAFQHLLICQRVPELFSHASAKAVSAVGPAHGGVQLGQAILIPLRAKMIGIIGIGNKSWDGFADAVGMALGANQRVCERFQGKAVIRAMPIRPMVHLRVES